MLRLIYREIFANIGPQVGTLLQRGQGHDHGHQRQRIRGEVDQEIATRNSVTFFMPFGSLQQFMMDLQ